MLPLEFPRHFAGSVFLAEGAVEATATAIDGRRFGTTHAGFSTASVTDEWSAAVMI